MAEGFPTAPVGLNYTNASINALAANQAGSAQAVGTVPVAAADPGRRALKIMPPVDCFYAIEPGATSGLPLYGGIANTLEGTECPTNAIYVGGLSANAKLVIWKA